MLTGSGNVLPQFYTTSRSDRPRGTLRETTGTLSAFDLTILMRCQRPHLQAFLADIRLINPRSISTRLVNGPNFAD